MICCVVVCCVCLLVVGVLCAVCVLVCCACCVVCCVVCFEWRLLFVFGLGVVLWARFGVRYVSFRVWCLCVRLCESVRRLVFVVGFWSGLAV